MSMDTGELDTGNIIESLFEAGKKFTSQDVHIQN